MADNAPSADSTAVMTTRPQRMRPTKPAVADPPEPPDGGWAWIVLAGAFLTQLLAFGFYGAAAVYVIVWMEYFDSSATETSLVISFSSCLMGVLSIIAGALITRFGVRAVWVTGGAIATAGLVISALATSILYLDFSMSFITALGFSMCINSGFVALGQYFKKRLSLAVGVASAGFAAGQLVLTPLFNFLIDEYGWRGSMIIFAGIFMHTVAAGAIVRPLPPRTRKRNKTKTERVVGDTPKTESITKISGQSHEKRQGGLDEEASSKNGASSNTIHADSPVQDDSVVVCIYDNATQLSRNDDVIKDISSRAGLPPSDAEISPIVGEKSGASTVQQLHDFNYKQNGNSEVLPPENIESTAPEISLSVKPTTNPPAGKQLNLYFSRLRTFMLEQYGLSGLFHNPSFILIIPIGVAHGFGWASVVFHLDARAESVGLLPTEGAAVIAIMGGGAFATSISHGWFLDRWNISPIITYILAIICNGLMSFIMSPLVTFGHMAATSALFGMATGIAEPVIFVILQVLVKPSEVAGATSIFLVCWGVGEIIGATLAGFIYDSINSYNNAYYMSGSVFIIAAMLGTVIYSLERRKVKIAERLVNGTYDVNIAVQRTTGNEIIESSQGREDGIDNPVYAATNESEA